MLFGQCIMPFKSNFRTRAKKVNSVPRRQVIREAAFATLLRRMLSQILPSDEWNFDLIRAFRTACGSGNTTTALAMSAMRAKADIRWQH
jgi:hypothetical protein